MSKPKLLIVDNSEDFPIALSQYLSKDYQVKYCLDGKEALSLLQSFQPDILFTEIIVPGLDGITLLETAATQNIRPLVMTFTLFYNEYMIAALSRLNVHYWMIKPCDRNAVADRLRDLTAMNEEPDTKNTDPQQRVEHLLFILGITTKYHGFAYLKDAVLMELEKPGQSVTKEIYPAISKKYNCSIATVEHAIRTVLQSAWEKRNDAIWQQVFLTDASGTVLRPTNATAINRIAQALRERN